jgi:phage tail protein X
MARESRYKDTLLYQDGSVVNMGLMVPPAELGTIGTDWPDLVLTASDIGGLDRVAVRLYGAGSETLWWAVLLANGIIHAERELYPGIRIKVPPLSAVRTFLAR